jgi:hypothetical protein
MALLLNPATTDEELDAAITAWPMRPFLFTDITHNRTAIYMSHPVNFIAALRSTAAATGAVRRSGSVGSARALVTTIESLFFAHARNLDLQRT